VYTCMGLYCCMVYGRYKEQARSGRDKVSLLFGCIVYTRRFDCMVRCISPLYVRVPIIQRTAIQHAAPLPKPGAVGLRSLRTSQLYRGMAWNRPTRSAIPRRGLRIKPVAAPSFRPC
jgi:hypothetical protein